MESKYYIFVFCIRTCRPGGISGHGGESSCSPIIAEDSSSALLSCFVLFGMMPREFFCFARSSWVVESLILDVVAYVEDVAVDIVPLRFDDIRVDDMVLLRLDEYSESVFWIPPTVFLLRLPCLSLLFSW